MLQFRVIFGTPTGERIPIITVRADTATNAVNRAKSIANGMGYRVSTVFIVQTGERTP